uniref:Kinesin-like protein n=1 Tax=Schizaphis graminum TaxID=13262 RepID=A0A2S2N868_SCHGA
MVKRLKRLKRQSIKVYCRLKPLKKNDISVEYEIINDEVSGIDVLDLKHESSKNNHNNKYQFHGVFEENISQSLIFDNVAVPILNKFLSGMNGTIFTYGQTSSGKTHTMYGSKEDQGIIPRTFEYLFKDAKDHAKYNYKLQYIEIYNEKVYDLLAVQKSGNNVQFRIGKNGDIEYINLNEVSISNFNDALKHIKSGNLKKNISSTSMNNQSSRSHCICIIKLNVKRGTSKKLNLVDLAGSERISKFENNEKTVIESRYINTSLHYLNHVINVLANPKTHVPYRNSTITSVLKGSLGTKCATAMIATVVLNQKCIGESMSTCRFSKAVSAMKQFSKTKFPSKSLSLKNKMKRLEIQKLTWEKENEIQK